jgi:hypothetical protein
MKVGDTVRQNFKLIEFRGSKAPKLSDRVGVIVEISDRRGQIPEKYTTWGEWLGRSVTVLWATGKLTENLAENSLDVIDEDR